MNRAETRAWPEHPDPALENTEHMLPAIPKTARCERCGCRAYVSALFMASMTTLYFCSHHYRIHETAINSQADEVRDERYALVAAEKVRRGATAK